MAPFLGRLSPRRRLFVGGVAGLVAVIVVAVVVSVLVSGGGTSAAPPAAGIPAQDRPGPVLLVPGYGGSTGSLSVLARRIRAAGRAATVLHLPGKGTGSLIADAGVLNAAVNRDLRDGAPSVDVIGYSAGGVAALVWARQDGGMHKARRVITLGSPFHGTQLASAAVAFLPGACPTACRQLVPGSSLLTQLDSGRRARPPALAVPVDHRRPDGYPAGLRPAGRGAQRAHPVGVPGCAGQSLPAADQPGGHRDGPAGAPFRPGPDSDGVGLRWLTPAAPAAEP